MPLAKPEADWADYTSHLSILLSWLGPLEQWLSGFNDGPQGQTAPEFIYYSKVIEADLAEANIETSAAIFQKHWPKSQDPAYRWGISYVIEGSQLGGEFLYKRLSVRLAPHRLRYLQKKNAGRWSEFLQAMALHVTEPQQISAACAGAIDAFDALLIKLRTKE